MLEFNIPLYPDVLPPTMTCTERSMYFKVNRCLARSALFLGPKIRILAQKSVFCKRTPDFIDGPFVVLGKTANFAPLDQFVNFSFFRNGRFRKNSPTPLVQWGTVCQ